MKSDASNELQVPSLTGNKIRFNIYPFNSMVNWLLKINFFFRILAQSPLFYIKSDWSYIFGLCVQKKKITNVNSLLQVDSHFINLISFNTANVAPLELQICSSK